MVQYFVLQMQAAAFAGGDEFDIDALSTSYPFGRSALYLAALGGHKATVRWLIDQGASDREGAAYLACTDPRTRELLKTAAEVERSRPRSGEAPCQVGLLDRR